MAGGENEEEEEESLKVLYHPFGLALGLYLILTSGYWMTWLLQHEIFIILLAVFVVFFLLITLILQVRRHFRRLHSKCMLI